MPNSLLPSFIGNIQATRDRLSAVRQRMGLEGGQTGQMQPLAPSPPNGPAQVTGQAQAAVQATPVPPPQQGPVGGMEGPANEIDYDNFEINPQRRASMLQQAQAFLDQYGPAQQARIDAQRAAAQQQTQQAAQTQQATQVVSDPNVTQALAPLAAFFRANGRLPTAEELRQTEVRGLLAARLGRDPTPTEMELFMEAPPKPSRK